MLNNVALARYLDPYNFGTFLLALSIFELMNVTASFGLPSLLPKFVAQFKTSNINLLNKHFSISLGTCLLSSIVFSFLLYILSPGIELIFDNPPFFKTILRILCLALPFTICNALLVAVFRGHQSIFPKVIIEDFLSPGMKIILFLLLFALSIGLLAAPIALLMANCTLFFCAIALIKRFYAMPFKPAIFDSKISASIFTLAWPLTMQSLIFILNGQIDRLFLGLYMTPKDIGIYGSALSIAMGLSLIPAAFNYLALPLFSCIMAGQNINDIQKNCRAITAVVFKITLPLFIVLTIYSDFLIKILYGEQFKEGSSILWILNVGVLSIAIIGPAADLLIAAEKTKAPFYSTILGLISNVVFNLILIPLYGIIGTALSFTCSLIMSRILLGIYIYRYLNIKPLKLEDIYLSIAGIIIAVLGMIGLRTIDIQSNMLLIVMAISIYIFSNYILLSDDQKSMILSIIKAPRRPHP